MLSFLLEWFNHLPACFSRVPDAGFATVISEFCARFAGNSRCRVANIHVTLGCSYSSSPAAADKQINPAKLLQLKLAHSLAFCDSHLTTASHVTVVPLFFLHPSKVVERLACKLHRLFRLGLSMLHITPMVVTLHAAVAPAGLEICHSPDSGQSQS